MREHPAAALLDNDLPIAQVTEKFDHEEWTALGSIVNEGRECSGKAMGGKFEQQIIFNVLATQEFKMDLFANSSCLEVQLDLHEGVLRQEQVGRTVRRHDHHLERLKSARKIRQKIYGGDIGPVE